MRAATVLLCNSCASLAGLVLCFIACFILLVITPLVSGLGFDLAAPFGIANFQNGGPESRIIVLIECIVLLSHSLLNITIEIRESQQSAQCPIMC